jgi:hypothetical protein
MLRSRHIRGAYRRAGLTVALALAALAALPAIASAAAVSTSGTVITYTAAGDENNNLTVTHPAANTYLFNEASISITESSTSCTASSGDVTCSGASWTSVVVNLNNKGDTFTAAGVNDDPFTINAGDDNDTITGSDADDTINGQNGNDTGLSGGPGNDTINAGDGNETINGGDGNDRLIGEAGNDTFNGDAGIDRVLYSIGCSESPPTITITIDGTANDAGCNSESADNVGTTVESVTGSTGNDSITGSCFANTFAGDPGSANGDAGGNDILNGDPSAGCTAASGSTDFLGGGEGNDTFNGDGLIDATHFKGFDTVTFGVPYTGHAATCSGFAVDVTFDDVANDCDGFGNITDNVNGDIERVIGSGLNDRINATAADQAVWLFGRAGNDTLTDSAFGDFLNGEGGADTINCPNGGTDTHVIDGSDTVTGSCEIGT